MIPGTVAVGVVFDVECATSFMLSIADVKEWDERSRRRIVPQGFLWQRYGTDGLVQARNGVVERFLKTDAEWLFWLDSDMGVRPAILDQLLSVADPDTAPIVGGLCFMQVEVAQDGQGGFRCLPRVTIFDWKEGLGQRFLESRPTYPVNALVPCGGTGSACVIIHRSIFEKIKKEHGPRWYDRVANDSTGRLVSEDLSFCIKADVPIHVYTAAKTTHLKHLWLGEEDFWQAKTAQPADEPVAVIVPVMRRPQAAAKFMRSLRASTGLATVYAVADPLDVDTQQAWKDAGATVLISDRGYTFAQKANCGYLHTSEPWLFLAGDDVHFHPGWFDHALEVARTENVSVVGTDDLGNASVRNGEHATHPLVRRSYVDEQGASWDGPGVLCHEGYGHWYVDNEWTMVAKQRGQFGMALGAVVEHLHPLWRKGDPDDVYEQGQRSRDADRRCWERRYREFVRNAA